MLSSAWHSGRDPVKIPIAVVRETMINIGKVRGLSEAEATLLADDCLTAELYGIRTHGLVKHLMLSQYIASTEGLPEIVHEASVSVFVNGNKTLGVLAGHFCADVAIRKAQEHGISLVGLSNASRYGRLAPHAERIADSGFIGIVMNCGGAPAVVAPHGSSVPVLGGNPICVSFPIVGRLPLTIDFTTSQVPFSTVLLALIEGKRLPSGTFFDQHGQLTEDAQSAVAVQCSGGPKGYGLCLAIEILCGALLGTKMGTRASDQYELGCLFIALSPLMFRSSHQTFSDEISQLLAEVESAPALDQANEVRIPGERARQSGDGALRSGRLDIHPKIWHLLVKCATDPSINIDAFGFLSEK